MVHIHVKIVNFQDNHINKFDEHDYLIITWNCLQLGSSVLQVFWQFLDSSDPLPLL